MYIPANRESSSRAFITIPPMEVEETRQQYSQKIVSASGTFAFQFLHCFVDIFNISFHSFLSAKKENNLFPIICLRPSPNKLS